MLFKLLIKTSMTKTVIEVFWYKEKFTVNKPSLKGKVANRRFDGRF